MEGSVRTGTSEPIRLFKSDFLEFFSHIGPVTVLVIWIPVIVVFLVLAALQIPPHRVPVEIVGGLLVGWFLWTLTEYLLHRFIFHFHPKTERLKRLFFVVHGVHHAQPLCRTRLVMPPVMSIPLGVLFFGLFYLIFDLILGLRLWLYPAYAGILIGYVMYDMMHYGLHHAKVSKGYLANCRFQHMQHHGSCPNMRFGVTSPVWDLVFGTMPNTPRKFAPPKRAVKG